MWKQATGSISGGIQSHLDMHKLGYAFYEGLGIPSLIAVSFSVLLTSNSS